MGTNKNYLRKMKLNRYFVILVFFITLIAMKQNEATFKLYSKGAGLLDMSFGYTAVHVYELFSDLGSSGRLVYMELLCIDFIFVMSFLIIQSFITEKILGITFIKNKWQYILILSYLRAFLTLLKMC